MWAMCSLTQMAILNWKKFRRKKNLSNFLRGFLFCDPAGIRTQGPYIKSVLLYQLSYEIIFI